MSQLRVRQEELLDSMFRVSLQFPAFLQRWRETITSQCYGRILSNSYKTHLKNSYNNHNICDSVKLSLNMFDEFRNIEEGVKSETLGFSVKVMQVCIR